MLSPGITNTTFCLSSLFISIWCTNIIYFYNNSTFYNEKDHPSTKLLLNPYLCYSTRLIWKSESFESFKVLHVYENYKMSLTWCRKSNKITLPPKAQNHPGTCLSSRWELCSPSAPLLRCQLSFWACKSPCKLIFVGSVAFSQSFHTYAVLAVAVKLLPISTGLLCEKEQKLHDSCSAYRHNLWITAQKLTIPNVISKIQTCRCYAHSTWSH